VIDLALTIAADTAATTGVTTRGVMNLLAAVALVIGMFFMFVGAVGILRFPDAYQRLHAGSKCTTLGLTGLLLAACLHMTDTVVVSKAIITVVFTFVANPVGSHLIAKAAHHGGLRAWERTLSDDLAEDKADPRRAASNDFIGATGLDDASPPPAPASPADPTSASERGAA
jgi:multicomponent Na+:H+ antiporter subunit G